MRILIDENILPKAKMILNDMKHDAILSKDAVGIGASDDEVFKYACENDYAVLTQNGKDFVLFIPPVISSCKHPGLIWIKSEVTKKNCDKIIGEIGNYFGGKVTIRNLYFSVKYSKIDNNVNIVLKYPKNYSIIYQIN